MKYFLTFITVIMLLGVTAKLVEAHFLISDNTMVALIHFEPDDDPVSGDQTAIHISLSEKNNKLTPTDCDCTFSISDNGQKILSTPFQVDKQFFKEILFVFPHSGPYTLTISGKGTYGKFPAFNMKYDFTVNDKATPAPEVSTKKEINYLPVVVIGIVAVAGAGIISLFRKKKKD